MPVFGVFALLVLVLYGVLGYKRPGIALVTVLPTAVALGVVSLLVSHVEYVIVSPLMLLVTVAVVAVSGNREASEQQFDRWARCILYGMGLLVFLPFGFFVSVLLGPAWVLLVALAIASLLSYAVTSRWATATYVFSTIGASMRQNLPLPMALDCAAVGGKTKNVRILRAIQKWLVQGHSVVESIRRGYPGCPPRILAMLSAGDQLGQLPEAIEVVQADVRSRSAERRRLRPVDHFFTIAYPIVVVSIMFMILLGLMTFVLPTFKTVMEEMFEGDLPRLTRIMLTISTDLIYGHGLVWIAVILLVVAWMAIPLRLRGRFSRRRPGTLRVTSRITDFVKWHMPGLHWFERNYSTLQVVELLRLSLHAGSPVDRAIAASLDLDVNACFRRRLRCWLDRVQRGDDIAVSARQCGLGTPLAWAFDRNAGMTDAPTVLGMLESFYRSNYSYRVNMAKFILWPCTIIALGLVVGTVVLSVFLPLVTVITHMAAQVYP